ncbi:MAG: Ig domain-containing protein [Lachnospiraceae bacterium]|nr:Ig domain-containing protein [Lachnospiraceae bacterium]
MKNIKGLVLYSFFIMLVLLFPMASFAHSGRTDSSGGHKDNKNKSGLGSYHYHCGGHPAHLHTNGVCPYSNNGGSSKSTVNTPAPTPVPTPVPTRSPSISLKSYPNILKVGESSKVEYSIEHAADSKSEIISSSPEIVKVNKDGTLTGVGVGTAEITIKASGVVQTFPVEVQAIPVDHIQITNVIDKLQLGKTYKFNISVLPDNATDKTVTWQSDHTEILDVNHDGTIVAKSAGVATITCVSLNNIECKAVVEVYEILPQEIRCEDFIKVTIGDTYQLSIDILPKDTNRKEYTIISDDEGIVKCSDSSISALNEGTATLSIETWNGIKKEIPVQIEAIPVKDIKIQDTTDYMYSNIINTSDKILLDVEISPSNATHQDVIWKSSDKSIIDIEHNEFIIKGTGKVILSCIVNDSIREEIEIVIINKNLIIGISMVAGIIIVIVCFFIYKKVSKRKMSISN